MLCARFWDGIVKMSINAIPKLKEYTEKIKNRHEEIIESAEIKIKYQGYIEHQQDEIDKQKKNENTYLPLNFDYNNIPGLSKEVIFKLNDFKPETIGKASRISGITPAAISILLVHLKKLGLLGIKEKND